MHIPVLLEEVVDFLSPQKDQIFVDCTFGGGGHARAIANNLNERGRVIGIDYDRKNIANFSSKADKKIQLVLGNFKDIDKILKQLKIKKVHGILLDLGFSSDQLNTVSGLSFASSNRLLDMRIDSTKQKTAMNIINQEKEERLEEIFRFFGEELRAKVIAKKINLVRKQKVIKTVGDLVNIIQDCYYGEQKIKGMNVATKVFMALRIVVNDEIENLREFLTKSINCLEKGGRVAIISFHSIEDRIVKNFFKEQAKKCICGKEVWRCSCNHSPTFRIITKKPKQPTEEEINRNPRSRSAKLRVAEKI